MIPPFSLTDLNGRRWTEDDLLRPTVLFAFASWCTCREQLPAWERLWRGRRDEFQMLGVAVDTHAALRIPPIAEEHGVSFPLLLDPEAAFAAALGFRVVPSGFFVRDGCVVYRHTDDFSISDPRVRQNVDMFLAGDTPESVSETAPMDPRALELFAGGSEAFHAADRDGALARWREALALDPDNFLIRSQIWTVEHPEHFWPVVDRGWQELQLSKEGYEGRLP